LCCGQFTNLARRVIKNKKYVIKLVFEKLTCPNSDFPADDFPDVVGRGALVGCGVHVGPEAARLEGEEVEAAVAEDLAGAGNRDDRLVFAGQPVDDRHRAALRQTVDPHPGAVGKVDARRRLPHETRTLVAKG